jgi:phage pi2 protein 07
MIIERSLINKKEWLELIFDGGKVWEMRTTQTKVRGRVGLIESGTGLIVGEVRINESFPINPVEEFIIFHKVENLELIKKWKYAWSLSHAIRYKTPIPYKHPKGAVIWVKTNHFVEANNMV